MGRDAPEMDSFRVEWRPRESLARHVDCVWAERSNRDEPLLPDAAVELVWSGTGLFVRGADTRPHAVGSFPERTFVVVRFRPGAGAGVLGLHGMELADARVGVSALWGRGEMERLESRLAACTSAAQAASCSRTSSPRGSPSRPIPPSRRSSRRSGLQTRASPPSPTGSA